MKEQTNSKVVRMGNPLWEIDPVIAGRWSSRAIDPDVPVSREQVHRLLEAARWAPSSFNNQPWRYLVLTEDDPQALQKGRDALMKGNDWARNAPVLVFSIALVSFRGKSRENWRRGYETGMSVLSMAYQAVRENLVFHQMAGFSIGAVREAFGVSEAFDIFAAIAVGAPGRDDLLDDQKRPLESEERTRLHPDEFICWNQWEELSQE